MERMTKDGLIVGLIIEDKPETEPKQTETKAKEVEPKKPTSKAKSK